MIETKYEFCKTYGKKNNWKIDMTMSFIEETMCNQMMDTLTIKNMDASALGLILKYGDFI
jgi:hypothetical protein